MTKAVSLPIRRVPIRKALLGIVCGATLGIGAVAASIYAYGSQSARSPAQAAIVLGAAVWGQEPSPVLRERINHAIVLYHAGQVQKLLFTGGVGRGNQIAESEASRRYALHQGVPPADILTENRSHSTWENLCYAQQVARPHQLHSFLIVSDPLHMKRAMAMAADLGLSALPSPTPTTRYKTFRSQWGFLIHETYFYIDYKLRHILSTG